MSVARMIVSIHAPTRGATSSCFLSFSSISSFNPRSHEGSDEVIPSFGTISCKFQSTLPRGERQMHKRTFRTHNYRFNPRSHEGSDRELDREGKLLELFQSTLPRGERHLSLLYLPAKNCFNPRSHEGSDRTIGQRRQAKASFNPRSHEGSDRASLCLQWQG